MACRYLRLHSVLKIFYQVDVLVLRGPAEVHKALGRGYAVVIDHAEKVTFAMILSFRRVVKPSSMSIEMDPCTGMLSWWPWIEMAY